MTNFLLNDSSKSFMTCTSSRFLNDAFNTKDYFWVLMLTSSSKSSGIVTSNIKLKSYILPNQSLLPHANVNLYSLSFLNVDPGHNMTELFDKRDVASLLRDKTIMLLGGSVSLLYSSHSSCSLSIFSSRSWLSLLSSRVTSVTLLRLAIILRMVWLYAQSMI